MLTKYKSSVGEAIAKGSFKRWRKERGIKLVVSIVPFKNQSRAVSLFEGKPYVVLGKTNVEALNNLFSALKAEANLN